MMACASPMASTMPLSLPIISAPPEGVGTRPLQHRAPASRRDLRRRAARRGRLAEAMAAAVAGVAHGDGQCIGLIGAFEFGARQQEADHGRNLSLFAVARARDRLF